MPYTNVCFTSFLDEPPTWNPETMVYLIYQRERCPDTGNLHWQSYCEFKRDKRLKTIQRELGIGQAHVERREGPQAKAIEYCKKPESRVTPHVEWGQPKAEQARTAAAAADRRAAERERVDGIYRRAHAEPDFETAMAIIRDELPADYSRGYNNIRASLAHKIKPAVFHSELQYGWRLPNSITKWLAEEFTKVERAKCLVLVGPSRLGKTAWARSLGKHMFWRTDTNLGNWDQAAKYIVIDDIPWKFIPKKKALLTQMGDITITDKYKAKMDVNNNKPAIVLVNVRGFEEQYNDDEPEYWDANATIVYLDKDKPLFDKTQRAINPDRYSEAELYEALLALAQPSQRERD